MKKNKTQINSKGFSMPDENVNSSNVVNDVTSSSNIVVSSVISTPNTSVKPTTTTTPVKTNMPKETPVKKSPTNTDKLDVLINTFVNTVDAKKESITQWINLCNYINSTNDPKVFQKFYTWFAQNKNKYTDCSVALNGIHNIQNANTKTRAGATHQCFEEMIRVRASRTAHYRFTMRAMQAMNISDTLAQWLLRSSER